LPLYFGLTLSRHFPQIKLPSPFVHNETQLVFPANGQHNHLGDLLGLTLLISFYRFSKGKEKKYLLAIAFFLAFFIMVFSRSAWLDLAICLIFVLIHRRKDIRFKKTLTFSCLLF
jgi:O-antigen ligase